MSDYAIIDVGSNSVRILFRGEKRINNTQLAENLLHTGKLSDEAMKRTFNAIKTFADEAKASGADDVFAFATEAVRSASNGGEFLNAVRSAGIKIELLPSEEEGILGFRGAYVSGTPLVMDIGGASSEITVGNEREILYSRSLPIGSVRTKDYSLLRSEQEEFAKKIVQGYGEIPKHDELISIGGSVSTLFAVYYGIEPYDKNKVHGASFTYDEISACVDRINALDPAGRRKMKGMHPNKIFVAPAGGVVCLAIMDYLGEKTLRLSEADNLEGYLKNIESGSV